MKNLRSIDLNLLVAFEALMRERNVSRAADRIGLAQPSMSNALARLRAVFDDELFVTTPKEMRPTRRAMELAGPVTEALQQVRLALDRDQPFDPAKAKARFRVGIMKHANVTLLPPLVEMLETEAPSISVFFRALTNEQVAQALYHDDVDVAIGVVSEVPRRFAIRPLHSDRAVCLARRDHPALKNGLTLRAFVELPHVRASLSEDPMEEVDIALTHKGLERRFAMIVPTYLSIPVAVAHSAMLGVVPEKLARSVAALTGVVIHEVPLDLAPWTLSVMWSKHTQKDRGVCWLRDRISATLTASPDERRMPQLVQSTAGHRY